MLKKLLIALAAVFAVALIALAAAVAFIDVNRFKPQIAQAVSDRYQRTLTIDGDLSLALLPRIGIALPRTTLSERGSAQVAASVDGARVSLALLPLLGGRIEAGIVSIYGLNATVEWRADGSTSIDDLIGASPAPTAQTPTGTPSAPPFDIGGIELANATLTWRDLKAGNTVTLTKLNLETGRLANAGRTPVRLTTAFAATRPAAQGELSAEGKLDYDLAQRRFGATEFAARLRATVEKRAVELDAKVAQAGYDMASGSVSATRLTAAGKGAFGAVTLDEAKVDTPALAWDPAGGRLSLGGVQAAARGRLAADGGSAQAFDTTLTAPKIEITESGASGERVTATIKLSGAQNAEARLTADGLAGSAKSVKIARLALDATATQQLGRDATRTLVAALATPLTFSVEAKTLSLPQLAGDITVDDPALPQKRVKLALAGAIGVDAGRQRIDGRFTARFDDTTLGSEFDLRGFGPTTIGFEASADRLNLDRYFPPARPAPGNDSADPREDPTVDLSALRDLRVNGEARVGQLQARGVRAQNLRVVLKAADGRLELAPLTAALYGGSVSANARVQADGNRIAAAAGLTDVQIGPLLKDAFDTDVLAGRGNVRFELATAGGTLGALKRGLNGTGALQLRDGAFKGVNVAATLRNARAFLTGGATETGTGSGAQQTDFTELSASFTVRDGVAGSDDLHLASPLLRVAGAGRVDLAAGTLDYTVRASVVGTLRGQDGRDVSELRGVTVPIRLTGPFEKISYAVDWGAVAREALKSEAAEQARRRVEPQLQEQRRKLEERARDALKGLLGR